MGVVLQVKKKLGTCFTNQTTCARCSAPERQICKLFAIKVKLESSSVVVRKRRSGTATLNNVQAVPPLENRLGRYSVVHKRKPWYLFRYSKNTCKMSHNPTQIWQSFRCSKASVVVVTLFKTKLESCYATQMKTSKMLRYSKADLRIVLPFENKRGCDFAPQPENNEFFRYFIENLGVILSLKANVGVLLVFKKTLIVVLPLK